MSDHDWEVSDLAGLPRAGAYDIDITDGTLSKLCTCNHCGLSVVASEERMPADVEGLPDCRPSTYQAMEQVNADRNFLAAEVAAGALELPAGGGTPEIDVALSQLGVLAASILEGPVQKVAWGGRSRRQLVFALRLLEDWLEDWDRGGDVNWLPFDDEDENDAWEAENARFHPTAMLARVREIRERAERAAAVGEVMEA